VDRIIGILHESNASDHYLKRKGYHTSFTSILETTTVTTTRLLKMEKYITGVQERKKAVA
jgi:hypothetical protein